MVEKENHDSPRAVVGEDEKVKDLQGDESSARVPQIPDEAEMKGNRRKLSDTAWPCSARTLKPKTF